MVSDTKMSKTKGLKVREKAQKDMAKAKRAAAAARQAKSKKGSKAEKKIQVVVVQEPIAEDVVQQTVTSSAEETTQEKEFEVAAIQAPVEEDTVPSLLADIAVVDEDVSVVPQKVNEDTVSTHVYEVSQEKPVVAVVLVAQDTSLVAEKIREDVSEKIVIPTTNVEAPSSSTIPQDTEVAASVTVTQDELAAKAAATAAHRKKLEADLYDNMESGQQRFARLHGIARINRMTSATAEYHYKVDDVVDDDAVSDYSLANADESKRAADDTDIEYVAAAHDAAAHTPEDATVPESTDVVVDDAAAVASNESETTTTKSITWAQLLFSTTNAGASTGSAPRAKSPLTLAEVEKMQAKAKAASETSHSRSVDIDQLFAADKAERAIVVQMPKVVAASTVPEITDLFAAEGAPIVRLPPARDWACVLSDMTLTCMDEIEDDESPVEAVVRGHPEELADVSEVPSTALEGDADDKPVLDVLQLGAEKLMSMIGVDGRVPTAAPTQQNRQEGADQIMAILGIARPRTTSGSTVPTPPPFSPVMNGGQSTPNTDMTVTPPPLDDGLAKPNTHNVSNNVCGAGQAPNMGASSVPYGYQNLSAGPQYAAQYAAQYVADPFFHGYYPHGLPGYPNIPFYGQW